MSTAPPSIPATYLPAACHSLMERSPVPMAELGGAGHLMRYVNPAFCRLAGKSKQALLGKPFADAMQDGDACLAVFDRVYHTGEAETHAEPEDAEAGPDFWSYAVWPVLDAGQRPAGLMMQVTETTRFHREAGEINEALLISSVRQHEQTEAAEEMNDRLRAEIVERERVEAALSESEERFRMLFALAPMAVFACDRDAVIQQYNERAVELWGREPVRGVERHCGSVKLWLPDGTLLPHSGSPLVEVLRTGTPVLDVEVSIERPDGSRLPVLVNFAPLRNAAKEITGAITSFVDITERKRAEQRQKLLLNELAHRGKNLLAVIQSIVSRSLSGEHSIAEAREALIQRIQALARSQTTLLNGAFEGAPLAEIVRLEFEAFSGRVKISGPDLMLSPKAAQSFALLVHELATNATKHGALSRPRGKIAIAWSIENAEAEPAFRFRWRERGGPPAAEPTRQGFGRILTERVTAQEFDAKVEIDYAPEGLSYEFTAPLSAVAASRGTTLTGG